MIKNEPCKNSYFSNFSYFSYHSYMIIKSPLDPLPKNSYFSYHSYFSYNSYISHKKNCLTLIVRQPL